MFINHPELEILIPILLPLLLAYITASQPHLIAKVLSYAEPQNIQPLAHQRNPHLKELITSGLTSSHPDFILFLNQKY